VESKAEVTGDKCPCCCSQACPVLDPLAPVSAGYHNKLSLGQKKIILRFHTMELGRCITPRDRSGDSSAASCFLIAGMPGFNASADASRGLTRSHPSI
jgi:hypothetical protein